MKTLRIFITIIISFIIVSIAYSNTISEEECKNVTNLIKRLREAKWINRESPNLYDLIGRSEVSDSIIRLGKSNTFIRTMLKHELINAPVIYTNMNEFNGYLTRLNRTMCLIDPILFAESINGITNYSVWNDNQIYSSLQIVNDTRNMIYNKSVNADLNMFDEKSLPYIILNTKNSNIYVKGISYNILINKKNNSFCPNGMSFSLGTNLLYKSLKSTDDILEQLELIKIMNNNKCMSEYIKDWYESVKTNQNIYDDQKKTINMSLLHMNIITPDDIIDNENNDKRIYKDIYNSRPLKSQKHLHLSDKYDIIVKN